MFGGLVTEKGTSSCHGFSQSTRIPDLSAPIRDALAPYGLSDREAQVALALMVRLTVSETAERLGLSRSAVGTYRRRLFDKLGVDDEYSARSVLDATVGDPSLIPDEIEAACPRLNGRKILGSACIGISLACLAMHAALPVQGDSASFFLLKGLGPDFAVAAIAVGCMLALGVRLAQKRVTAYEYEAVAATSGLLLVIESMRMYFPMSGTLSWHAVRFGLGSFVWAIDLMGFMGLVFANVCSQDKHMNIPTACTSGLATLLVSSALRRFGVALGSLALALSVVATFATIARLRSLPFILKRDHDRSFNLRWDPLYFGALAGASACLAAVCAGIAHEFFQSLLVGALALPVALLTLLLAVTVVCQQLQAGLDLASDALVFLTGSAMLIGAGAGCGVGLTLVGHAFTWAWWLVLALGVACVACVATRAYGVIRARTSYVALDRADAILLSLESRGITLTRTEALVVAAVAEGLDVSRVADRMVVSRSTVNSHMHRVFKKCGVRTIEGLRAFVGCVDGMYFGRGCCRCHGRAAFGTPSAARLNLGTVPKLRQLGTCRINPAHFKNRPIKKAKKAKKAR